MMSSTTTESLESDFLILKDAFQALTPADTQKLTVVRQLRYFTNRTMVAYVQLGGNKLRQPMFEQYNRLLSLEVDLETALANADERRKEAARAVHKPGLTTRDPFLLVQFKRLQSNNSEPLPEAFKPRLEALRAEQEKIDRKRTPLPKPHSQTALQTSDPTLLQIFERLRNLK
ncbi:MAG: hypothetical protein SF162_10280 [bacterium]|nr:hypothetical protein [bacterium]